MDKMTTERTYPLVDKMNCPFYLTSAADGTNVVRVSINININIITNSFNYFSNYKSQIFEEIIEKSIAYKDNPEKGYLDNVLELLGDNELFNKLNK